MNWLITGGCGFIGRSLISNLLSEGGHSIRVFDNLSVGTRPDLEELGDVKDVFTHDDLGEWDQEIALFEGDIVNSAEISAAAKGADVVVHLAANTGVAPSVEDPILDCHANVIGTLNVLEACRHNSVKQMVFASSGAPLGVQTPPLNEELAPHPASPYGASKLSGEGYCSAYYHCFGIRTVALRFGNVFGERSKNKQSVVAKFIKLALQNEPLEIYGDGSQTRDFIYIDDLVDAVKKAAILEDVGGQVFQIASAQETTISELVVELQAAMASEGLVMPKVINGEERVGDVKRNFSDTSKAKRLLGWEPKTDRETALRRTVRYFLSQQ